MANSGSNAFESALRIKIADLERELRSEKDSFILLQSQTEVAKFVARQEVEKCRRNCSGLEDRVLRLEEDCKTLREREARDRERIRSLLREIEMSEREFKEKFIELKVEIRDLECGRKRALDEADDWKKKCAGLETERLSLVEEVARLKRKEEDCVVTPEQRRIGDLVASDTESEGRGEDLEDRIPLRNYKRKRVAEVVANGGKKGDEGLKEVSTSRGEACELGNVRENGNGMCVQTEEMADHANADEAADHADEAADHTDANEAVDHANANEAVDHANANKAADHASEAADEVNEGADNATEVVDDTTEEADEVEVKDAQILMEEAETKDSQISEDEKDAKILGVPDNGAQEDLEISTKSKSLVEVAKSKHKLLTRNRSPRSKKKFKSFILRCSSTARNVTSDSDGVVAGLEDQANHKRTSTNSKRQREYAGRVASSEQQHLAMSRAEVLQRNLNSSHPTFVRSVLRSHVSSCFYLGFPPKFIEENFPACDQMSMVLEDEKGLEHKVNYVSSRGGGLCGGWRAFALAQDLEIGDALLFELVEPTRFKVYIVKAYQEPVDTKESVESTEGFDNKTAEETVPEENSTGVIKQTKSSKTVPRSRPLRFRFVRRNGENLDMQSKLEEHV